MTWLDVTVVALFVIVGFVQAKRGAIPAAIDLFLVLTGLSLAKALTRTVGPVGGTEALPFLVFMLVAVAISVAASTVTDMYTKWDIGPFDAVAGAILGVIAGLVLGHAAFHAATLAGGDTATTASKSLLVIEVYDLRTFDALTDMLHNLGTGRKIVDEVKEQQN